MNLQRLDADAVQRLGGVEGAAAHVRGQVPDGSAVRGAVADIIDAVREQGDEALLRYTRELDSPAASLDRLVVSGQELDDALTSLPREVVAGLQVAIANVALVAEAGVSADTAVDLPQGQRVTLREVPVSSAAVYVPGGRAPYPSTVVMGVVTARAAGVIDVAVCSPPRGDGELDGAILGACRLCGVERVYRMGGAQAIAALALGTDAVAPVDVIVGPGNLYVQEAKQQLSGVVGIDGFAGPSDLLVLLSDDAGADAIELAALDMLAQAEHGDGSVVVAAAPAGTCDALAAALEAGVVEHTTVGEAAFALVQSRSAREQLAFANAFAPEHLELIGTEVERLAHTVTAAGCVFVGAASATAFGDYVAGSNHVLPTAGAARFASTLSPRHFRRRMSEVRIGDGAARLAAAGAPIARAEGFEVHARSMEARIRENPSA